MPESQSADRDAAPPFQSDHVLTISAGHAVHDTYSAFLPPLLPLFISRLGLVKTEAGLLTVFLQAPSLIQPLLGHLADRVSLRYFVILSPAVTAATMSLLGIAPTYGLLALLLLVAGLSSACLHAVGPVWVGYVSGARLGRGMGVWMVGGELGRTLGPLVVVSAVGWLTLGGLPWLMLGGMLASALLYFRLRSVPGGPPHAPQRLPWRESLSAMGPFWVPLIGIVIARAFLLSALTTYLPIYLSEEGAGLWLAGVTLTILEAAGVVGALVGGTISDRIGRRRVLAASLIATPLLMMAFLASSGWLRLLLLVGMGFAGLAVTPVIMAMVQESYPENRALANGVYMSVSFGLRSIAILALGAIGDLFGLRIGYLISAGLSLVAAPLVVRLPSRAGPVTD